MQILEIEVPDNEATAVSDFLQQINIDVKVKNNTPNAETIAAMEELKAGKGIKFKSVEELFKSIV